MGKGKQKMTDEIDVMSAVLKMEAIKNGLCEQWTDEWTDEETKDSLIMKMKRGMDFCLKHGYPDRMMYDTLKASFGEKYLKGRHIFLDEEFSDGHYSDVATIIGGESLGELAFSDYDTSTLYVMGDSQVTVSVSGNAIVFVRVYDKAIVDVIQRGEGKAIVTRYGEDAIVRNQGHVMLREKPAVRQNEEK